MKPYVITIGRQLGSGGRRIGRLLAEQLDIKYFDREILTIAAHESGYDQAIFERKDEKKGFISHAWHSLSPIIGAGDYYVNQLSETTRNWSVSSFQLIWRSAFAVFANGAT